VEDEQNCDHWNEWLSVLGIPCIFEEMMRTIWGSWNVSLTVTQSFDHWVATFQKRHGEYIVKKPTMLLKNDSRAQRLPQPLIHRI
jgi:hypothetical protein